MTRITEQDLKKFAFDATMASNGGKQTALDANLPKLHSDLQDLKDRFASDEANSEIIAAAEDVVHALQSVSDSGDGDGITAEERAEQVTPAWARFSELNVDPVDPATVDEAQSKIDGFVERLRTSDLGAAMLDSIASGNKGMPRIEAAPLNGGNPGKYDAEAHVLTINAAMVHEQPDKVVMALAHELKHAEQVRAGTYGADPRQDEADARAFAADVAGELGIDPVLAEGGARPGGAPAGEAPAK